MKNSFLDLAKPISLMIVVALVPGILSACSGGNSPSSSPSSSSSTPSPRPIKSRLKMTGSSMEPNFHDGQVVKVEKDVDISSLQRGDVIVFELDGNIMLKRLIALPGEAIEIREGSVLINGDAYEEPYEVIPPDYEQERLQLGENEYYVLGDNRLASTDSHQFGPIKGNQIRGRINP